MCVTAQVDQITFRGPIEIGEVIRVVSLVTAVGRTSLEVEVEVFALDALSGHERLTNTCFVTMVAVDEEGKPTPVPPLELSTDEQRARNSAALARMAERRKRRSS